MRLLLEIDYYKLLLPEDSDATITLKTFSGIQAVTNEGYGREAKYKPKEDAVLTLRLIHDDQILDADEISQEDMSEDIEEAKAEKDMLQDQDYLSEKGRAEGE